MRNHAIRVSGKTAAPQSLFEKNAIGIGDIFRYDEQHRGRENVCVRDEPFR